MLKALALAGALAPASAQEPPFAPCPPRPNCVVSAGPGASIAPLAFEDEPAAAWERLKAALAGLGIGVVEEGEGRLRAVAVTRLLRFKDDLELVLDPAAKVVHVRSASRVGRYDFGTNRRRVERLRAAFLRP